MNFFLANPVAPSGSSNLTLLENPIMHSFYTTIFSRFPRVFSITLSTFKSETNFTMCLNENEFLRLFLAILVLCRHGLQRIRLILQEVLVQHMQLISCNDLEEASPSQLFDTFESCIQNQIDVVSMCENIVLLDAEISVSTRLDHQDPSTVLRESDILQAICRVVNHKVQLSLTCEHLSTI